MAKFYGKPSKYLLRVALLSTLAVFAYTAIGFYVIIKYITTNAVQLFTFASFLVFAILFLPILLYIYSEYKKWDQTLLDYLQGMKGEDTVGKFLFQTLPNDYSIFRDAVVNKKYGNIDYVVMGPTGVFSLEVKSTRGNIGYSGNLLTRHGRNFNKDIIKQAKGEAWSLHSFIQDRLKISIYVNPVIVFSDKANVTFGNPVDGVHVMQKSFLPGFLESRPKVIYPLNKNLLEDQFKSLVDVL